jgi:soluble lytic murein transglycosylase-like protein
MNIVELLCSAVISLGLAGPTPSQNETYIACLHMEQIVQEATENQIDPAIMLALIHHESRWVPRARSRAGACGLTQVLPRYTGSRKTRVPKLTCNDLYNPTTSIMAGTRSLRYWIYSYGRRNIRVGLCGYNAGFRCKGANPHRSGMSYARTVLRTSERITRKVAELRRGN